MRKGDGVTYLNGDTVQGVATTQDVGAARSFADFYEARDFARHSGFSSARVVEFGPGAWVVTVP